MERKLPDTARCAGATAVRRERGEKATSEDLELTVDRLSDAEAAVVAGPDYRGRHGI